MTEIDTLKADLAEARYLLEEFRFIAHGPGCVCAMCERRTAFLDRRKPQRSLRELAAGDTDCDAGK